MAVNRIVVMVNASAGSVVDEDAEGDSQEILDAFAAAAPTVEVRVESVDPADLQDRIRRVWSAESRPDVVVVAGGDGTVNNAANAAAGTDIVLGVLPLGTFNHFARDLGIPDRLDAAVAALVDGEVRRVDVADVNGRVFVNNSLVGLYPTMVAIRDQVMESHGWGKVRSVVVAATRVFRMFPTHRLDLVGSHGFSRHRLRTPVLFVGNGVYESAPGAPPVRPALDGGLLGVEVARGGSRRQLVRAALQTLFRGASGARDIDRASLESLEVRTRSRRIRVAFDGEIDWLTSPLRYRIRPADLLVVAPRDR